jgi:iron-regulated transporter 1
LIEPCQNEFFSAVIGFEFEPHPITMPSPSNLNFEIPQLDSQVWRIDTIPSKSLYVSHFLSTWNSRGFEFGAVLFLAAIYPGTLMPMSIYALLRAAAAILFSPRIGQVIDASERLVVIRASIIGQRSAVVLSCCVLLFLLSDFGPPYMNYTMFAVLVLLSCVEKLCSIMNMIAVERDWVVVIADKQEDLLQEMNSQMRRIDLFCKLISPLAIALLDGLSTKVALLFTLVLNATVFGIEYLLIARVYRMTPALARRCPVSIPTRANENQLSEDTSSEDLHTLTSKKAIGPLLTYVSSTAFLPSLSLAVLYLTALSFSGQMTTFLLATPQPKMTSITIGILRTISTVIELTSTFIAPRLMVSIGSIRAGIWCLSWQVLCLTFGVGLLWASTDYELSYSIGVVALIVSVVLSRAGLWSFDLVAQFHIQSSIVPSRRGSFSSVEASLQNFFELCTFATTIMWAKPEQFKYPSLISLVATWAAAALYAKFVRDRRGHLLHLPPCLKLGGGSQYDLLSSIEDNGQVELEER